MNKDCKTLRSLEALGIYGKSADKELKFVNILQYMPVKVYRTSGNTHTPVTEYTGAMHRFTYDGKNDTSATLSTNNQQLDFVYDLCTEKGFCELSFTTENGGIDECSISISDTQNGVWEDKSVVYHETDKNVSVFSKSFDDMPVSARFVRFSVIKFSKPEISVKNICALGLNNQEAVYGNLIDQKSDTTSIILENKTDYSRKIIDGDVNKFKPSWTDLCKMYTFANAFNTNPDKVFNIFAGENNKETVNFLINLSESKVIDKISLLTNCDLEYMPSVVNFYFGDDTIEIFGKDAKSVKSFKGKSEKGEYIFDFLPTTAKYVRIEIAEACHPYYGNRIITVISNIAVFGAENSAGGKALVNYQNIPIDDNTVLCDDYLGIGTNFSTGALPEMASPDMPFFMSPAHLEINYNRINTLRPAFVRMLVMPHYIVDYSDNKNGADNWKNGKYDFSGEQIECFFKYVKAFKAAGTSVLINFGGYVDDTIADWFAIKDIADKENIKYSAPDDLESFAKAVAALLKECYKRGLDNCNMLSFYRQINNDGFVAFGDKRLYWCKMLKYVHNELKNSGIRDKVRILGSEVTGNAFEGVQFKKFLDYISENAGEYYDVLGTEQYPTRHHYSYICRLSEATGKRYPGTIITEFKNGVITIFNRKTDTNEFGHSAACQIISHTNAGMSGSANYSLTGTKIPAPVSSLINRGGDCMWSIPSTGISNVEQSYFELGLLMRYIPKHSKSIRVFNDDKRLYACAFADYSGNVTLVVENDASDNGIDISFSIYGKKDTKFNKFSYEYKTGRPQNAAKALLSECSGTVEMTDYILADKTPKTHSLTVYTTLPEAVQVDLETVETKVASGESVQLSVNRVIGSKNSDVVWSLAAGEGSVDNNGLYTASDATPGSFAAIRATSVEDKTAYSTVLVKIV